MHLINTLQGVRFEQISKNEWLLCIADNTEVGEPIELNLSKCNGDTRLTIQMGLNSRATVIERFENKEDTDIHYHHQINADSYSYLKVVTIQNLSENSKLTEIRDVRASKSAEVHLLSFQLGCKKVRGSLKQNAFGESGNINIDLLCRVKNKQDFNFNLSNTYHASNGSGRILAKGIALDNGKLAINGNIQINQSGGGTDTHLNQDCLLLSKNAKIKSTPSLNIDTDNVKAGHGASVSNINDESLFYLTSRGLSPDDARRMMINAFVAGVVDKLEGLKEVKQYVLFNI